MVRQPTVSAPGNHFHSESDIPSSFPTLPPCGEARSLEIERRYRMPSMGLAESKRFPYVSVSKHPAPPSLPFLGGGGGSWRGDVDRDHTWWFIPNITGNAVLSGD